MAAKLFQVVERNPNDTCGGGGCVCDEVKRSDCQPPYAVFYGNDMESTISPHVVICRSCAEAVLAKMDTEVLGGGERGVPLDEDDELDI